MADYAGAYGAGGAAQALDSLLAQKFLERKQAEVERAARAQEAAETAARAQQADQFRQTQARQFAELAATRDDRYQDRQQHVSDVNARITRQSLEDQIRAGERKGELDQRNKEREDEQAFRAEERKGNQAFQERLAGIYRQPKPQAERTVRVSYTDPETGQNVEEFMTAEEARNRGPFKPATKGAAGMKEKLADLFETERIARGILTKGKDLKWRGVGPLAGRISAISNEAIGNDPQVAALHADIGNVFSMISNERFGAALTAQELARATTFLPQKTDPAPVLQKKLENLIAFAESKRTNMGGQPMEVPGGGDWPDPGAGTTPRHGGVAMVKMQAPDGSSQLVPAEQVAHYQAQGARVVQ